MLLKAHFEETSNVIEEAVQKFWLASLAWRRIEGYYQGWTVEKLFSHLSDLEGFTHNGVEQAVSRQAVKLGDEIVQGSPRRKGRKKNNIAHLIPMTKNIGLDIHTALTA